MRRIVKDCKLSTKYSEWQQKLETDGKDHEPYGTRHRFYLDVVMNLFHCQGGLCAYTEMLLCARDLYPTERWQNGVYATGGDGPQVMGELDHFDSSLKKSKGWLWSNLFMVNDRINLEKGTRPVDKILKPDEPDYDPFQKLEYSLPEHMFLPNHKLDAAIQERIAKMLQTLGVNHSTVRANRRVYLTPLLDKINFNMLSWEDANPEIFPTAFQMINRDAQARTVAI